MKLTRKENGEGLKFSVYRKPTSKDQYIMEKSFHRTPHQEAAFHSMVHRAISISMEPKEFEDEEQKIHQIVGVNGYDPPFVERIFQQDQDKEL